MTCDHCLGASRVFGERAARRDLRRLQRKGPRKTTQWLIDGLVSHNVKGKTLLDVGGGVGAVQHAFVEAGGAAVTDVDASHAYLNVAREEARRRGHWDNRYMAGDFVALAGGLPAADYVTLDRVVCCYPSADTLVGQAAAHADIAVGLVWPRDRFLNHVGRRFANAFMWLLRNPFRTYIHTDDDVDRPFRLRGFHRIQHRQGTLWQMALYARGDGRPRVKANP